MKIHKKPIFPIRLLLQLASFLLCLLLIVSLDATILVEDLQALTSRDGIRTILACLAESSAETEDPALLIPTASSDGFVKLNSTTATGEYTVDENGNIIAADGTVVGNVNDPSSIPDDFVFPGSSEIPGDLEIPTDILTNPDALSDFIYDIASGMVGEGTEITPEQVETIVNESTVMDFLADKTATLIHDALTGNVSTIFTADEIMDLIDENQALLEETLQITITEEQKATMHTQVEQAIVDADLDNTVRESVDSAMHGTVHIGNKDVEVGELMHSIEWFTHLEALIDAIIVCLVLVALIMLANYYNLPQGLGWTATACTIAGIIMAAPLVIVHFLPALLTNILPQSSELLTVLDGFYFVMAPYHFAVLALGLILIVVSNVWRFFYKRQNAHA